ncbi:MAG: hypothetical protein ACKV2V_17360, partial [Blastocatellia bacterium]
MHTTAFVCRPGGGILQSIVIAALWLALAMPGMAQSSARRPDPDVSRLEALALLQTLNAELLAGSSATLTLEKWCRDHRMAATPQIIARRSEGAVKPPTAEQLQRLRVTDPGQVKYRRVELRCGAHLFSEADNWYVPGRLTAEMNSALETSDTPFGKVVQALRPYRRTFAVAMLWQPLPEGWEQRPRPRPASRRTGKPSIPKDLFEHRALLYTSDNLPFSEVREVYQGDLLRFPRAPR